jgi:hypothetical protein
VDRHPVALFYLALGLALFGVQNNVFAGFVAPARGTGSCNSAFFQDDFDVEGTLSRGAGQSDEPGASALDLRSDDLLRRLYNELLRFELDGDQFRQAQGGCGEPPSGSYSLGSGQLAGCLGNLPIPRIELTGLLFLKAMLGYVSPFVDTLFHPPRSRS